MATRHTAPNAEKINTAAHPRGRSPSGHYATRQDIDLGVVIPQTARNPGQSRRAGSQTQTGAVTPAATQATPHTSSGMALNNRPEPRRSVGG